MPSKLCGDFWMYAPWYCSCPPFQKSFITFLKDLLPARLHPKDIIYFSDGAASQYKNRKNFLNLCHHKDDFGVKAEWHFSATSHEKGACDGLGGTVKRLAARASLQRPYNDQLMTPRQLFDWACTNIPAVYVGYCSNEDYAKERSSLERRFQLSCTIPGTRKLHSFVPISNSTVEVRHFCILKVPQTRLSIQSPAIFTTYQWMTF